MPDSYRKLFDIAELAMDDYSRSHDVRFAAGAARRAALAAVNQASRKAMIDALSKALRGEIIEQEAA